MTIGLCLPSHRLGRGWEVDRAAKDVITSTLT